MQVVERKNKRNVSSRPYHFTLYNMQFDKNVADSKGLLQTFKEQLGTLLRTKLQASQLKNTLSPPRTRTQKHSNTHTHTYERVISVIRAA